MTYYFKSGNRITVQPSDSMLVCETLPPNIYTVKVNPLTQDMYLETSDHFALPDKIYGGTLERSDRIISTFLSRPRSTGTLLSGDKGSGKTLLAKKLAMQCLQKHGISTLVINEPLCGPKFNSLLSDIKDPVVVLFDEFDKVYDEEDQQQLLTVLDGTVEGKKLFVLTTNSGFIDSHLENRPGRIYYRYHYEGIERDFLLDYLDDNLKDPSHINHIMVVYDAFASFTFDIAQAMVEELNRYNTTVSDIMEHLNIDVSRENVSYKVSILYDGSPIENSYYPIIIEGNPMFMVHGQSIDIYKPNDGAGSFKNNPPRGIELTAKNLVSVGDSGRMTYKFTFENKDLLVILSRVTRSRYPYAF